MLSAPDGTLLIHSHCESAFSDGGVYPSVEINHVAINESMKTIEPPVYAFPADRYHLRFCYVKLFFLV